MTYRYYFLLLFSLCVTISAKQIIVGAAQTELYISCLKNKRVGVVTNHTALIGKNHLVDLLVEKKVKVKALFTPEHGLRGTIDAEIHCANGKDSKTGIPIISLYGAKKKPSATDLAHIDILLFDIQDIGVRFYTYISTLQYVMEAAAENNIPLIILDRPNPNGFYIDGPICEVKSFVGMQPIPLVHGMTVGEYARMLNGERWLATKACKLTVIPCKNYSHKDYYQLSVFPSPNITNMNAVYLYPSLGLLEGTYISTGRGTEHPFEMFGHPDFPSTGFYFIPQKPKGAHSAHLRYAGQRCNGFDLIAPAATTRKKLNKKINISWLQKAYMLYPNKDHFFTKLFSCLAGDKKLAQQIEDGISENEIRASWQSGLQKFKKIRRNYLLYEDFE